MMHGATRERAPSGDAVLANEMATDVCVGGTNPRSLLGPLRLHARHVRHTHTHNPWALLANRRWPARCPCFPSPALWSTPFAGQDLQLAAMWSGWPHLKHKLVSPFPPLCPLPWALPPFPLPFTLPLPFPSPLGKPFWFAARMRRLSTDTARMSSSSQSSSQPHSLRLPPHTPPNGAGPGRHGNLACHTNPDVFHNLFVLHLVPEGLKYEVMGLHRESCKHTAHLGRAVSENGSRNYFASVLASSGSPPTS